MANIIEDKSFSFSIRIINLYKYLTTTHKEFILSKQLLRSGTSIGANIKEVLCASSKRDFIYKLSIALKETNESLYWIELLLKTNYLTASNSTSLLNDCLEIKKLLYAIIKTSKLSLPSKN